MDISDMLKKPHLSVSSVNDYMECGLSYKLGRVDKLLPDYKSSDLYFGSAIHKALEGFYRAKMVGDVLTLEELLRTFEEVWKELIKKNDKNIRYKKGNNDKNMLKVGLDLLSVYHNDLPEDNFKVLDVENGFTFRIQDIPIPMVGFIDLIEEDEAGTIIITDFKTASKAYSVDDVDKSLQLTVYEMAMKSNGYHDREILLRFDVLVKTKTPKFEQYYTTRSENAEKRAIKKIIQVWDGISKGVFIPNDTSWKCKYCSYKSHCNEWFEGGNYDYA